MRKKNRGILIMKPNLQELMNVAVKVRTPLALAGLTIVVLYGIYKEVLSLNVFEKIGANATFILLQDILDKLFWLALLALVLGVASYLVTSLVGRKSQSHFSNVTLVDASLDSHDNPYTQTIEGGRKKIRYKGRQPKKEVNNGH